MNRITALQAVVVFVLLAGGATSSRPQKVSAQAGIVPADLEVITPENAAQVKQLAVLASYGIIGHVAWSPDGRTLALASLNGWIFLLGANELAARPRLLSRHQAGITAISFSPDGTLLASAGGDGSVRLWDVATGEGHPILENRLTSGLAFSTDGKLLAVGTGSTVKLLNTLTGEEIANLRGHEKNVTSVAFSSDGKLIASGSVDKTIRLWDVQTQTQLAVLEGHTDEISAVVFNPEGEVIVSSSRDGTVREWDWDPVRGVFQHTLQREAGLGREVIFSPDGTTLATLAQDQPIYLWDVGTGREKAVLAGHTARVMGVAFNPDGTMLASVSSDQTLRLWDVATGAEVRTVSIPRGHTQGISTAVFSPDGRTLASAGYDGSVMLRDAETGAQQTVIQGPGGAVWGVAFSPDGTALAYSSTGDQSVHLWDIATGEERAVFENAGWWGVDFNPDGSLIAAGRGDYPIRATETTITLWDVATGERAALLVGHIGYIFWLDFSQDGTLIVTAGSGDNTVRLWDVATGEQRAVLEGHTAGVGPVAFSPDGATVASGSVDNTLRLWDVATGEQRAVLEHADDVVSFGFSPDGRLIASGSGNAYRSGQSTLTSKVWLWDAATGAQLAVLNGHTDEVSAAIFRPDGRLLVSASGDGTIRLWGIEGGN